VVWLHAATPLINTALNTANSTHVTRTQHSEQYTHHTYDMLPHHCITYNDVVIYKILT